MINNSLWCILFFFFFVNMLHRWLIKHALENTCGWFVINADVLHCDCEGYNNSLCFLPYILIFRGCDYNLRLLLWLLKSYWGENSVFWPSKKSPNAFFAPGLLLEAPCLKYSWEVHDKNNLQVNRISSLRFIVKTCLDLKTKKADIQNS